MRMHWAIRDAYLHRDGLLPVHLDWLNDDDWVPSPHCEGLGVVEERHRALAWLTGDLACNAYDAADTST
jgi:hypothetical protein